MRKAKVTRHQCRQGEWLIPVSELLDEFNRVMGTACTTPADVVAHLEEHPEDREKLIRSDANFRAEWRERRETLRSC
jgi:hypothetical protein